ncbi:MAG: hypothetical protein WD772_08435 [Pseudohongiellaceae bacterium]
MKQRNLAVVMIVSVISVVALVLLNISRSRDESNPELTPGYSLENSVSSAAPADRLQQTVSAQQPESGLSSQITASAVDSRVMPMPDITAVVDMGSFLNVSRQIILSRYGKFIRDLPLSAAGKQEVRRLMVEVQTYNSELGQRLRYEEISGAEYREQMLRMDVELARLLSPDLITLYKQADIQANNQFRAQMSGSRERIVDSNLQRISGLTDENQDLLLDKLIAANGGESAENIYPDNVLYIVREELASVFDSDQLEVLDIFIESEQLRKVQIENVSRSIDNRDDYSSRFIANARANVNSQYGAFIRDLPISPAEKQQVRAIMVRVEANNVDLIAAMSSGQITTAQLSENLLRMDSELTSVLNASDIQTYNAFEERRRNTLSQASTAMQQQSMENNLKNLSGLQAGNKQAFMEALTAIEPFPGGGGRFLPDSIRVARDQLGNSLDSDQLEIIDIFLADAIAFQRNVDARQQQRQNN